MADLLPYNTHWLTPQLTVRDAESAREFYMHAFGFTGHGVFREGGKIRHAEFCYRGKVVIAIASEGAFGETAKSPATLGIEAPHSFYLYVDDVDSMFKRVTRAGARAVVAPSDSDWGDRYCVVTDPEGYRWTFARHLGQTA